MARLGERAKCRRCGAKIIFKEYPTSIGYVRKWSATDDSDAWHTLICEINDDEAIDHEPVMM